MFGKLRTPGSITKCYWSSRPRPKAWGRGWGRGQCVPRQRSEIARPRPKFWPRGFNILFTSFQRAWFLNRPFTYFFTLLTLLFSQATKLHTWRTKTTRHWDRWRSQNSDRFFSATTYTPSPKNVTTSSTISSIELSVYKKKLANLLLKTIGHRQVFYFRTSPILFFLWHCV